MKTAVALPSESDPVLPVVEPRSAVAILFDLTKARLTFLVLVTTLVGFYMGLGAGAVNYWQLTACMLGTMLCAAGAAALNQVWEKDPDSRMNRTNQRPLPSGEMPSATAGWIGICLCLLGLGTLWRGVNLLSTLLALTTIFSYLLIYTPLKKITSLNTLAGAIPGALPPVIGYAAAANRLDLLAAVLFAILFFWQLPHFLAISWLYREDYRRGGFVMLACRDENGREVAGKAVAWLIVLLAVSSAPFFIRVNSSMYLLAAALLGAAFLWPAIKFCQLRDRSNARRLFFASIIYLPILLGVMVFTRR